MDELLEDLSNEAEKQQVPHLTPVGGPMSVQSSVPARQQVPHPTDVDFKGEEEAAGAPPALSQSPN